MDTKRQNVYLQSFQIISDNSRFVFYLLEIPIRPDPNDSVGEGPLQSSLYITLSFAEN